MGSPPRRSSLWSYARMGWTPSRALVRSPPLRSRLLSGAGQGRWTPSGRPPHRSWPFWHAVASTARPACRSSGPAWGGSATPPRSSSCQTARPPPEPPLRETPVTDACIVCLSMLLTLLSDVGQQSWTPFGRPPRCLWPWSHAVTSTARPACRANGPAWGGSTTPPRSRSACQTARPPPKSSLRETPAAEPCLVCLLMIDLTSSHVLSRRPSESLLG